MVRPRREDDLEGCVALLRRVYEIDRYPVIWPPDTVGWLTHRDALAAWVAVDGERLLGHLSLHTTDASRVRPEWCETLGVAIEELAVVSRFFVAPTARGSGIGGALMGCAEAHAARHDLRLVLDVAAHNRDAIGFYERRGWQRVGTTELSLSAEPWTLPLVLFVLP